MELLQVQTKRYYDRSRTTTDWSCRRKRYLQYEYNGKGIVSGNLALELYTGSCLHDGLAAIATGIDIDTIADAARKQMYDALMLHSQGEDEGDSMTWANEQASLVEGLLRGLNKHVWPKLTAAYPVIKAIEQEMTFEHDGLVFMSKPDLVVADNDGNLFYVEYKSTSSKKDNWVNSWGTAVQLHSTIRAIEQTLGEKVTGVIVQGLYKGFESYGKQSSPFCYAYVKRGQPPFSETQISYEYKAGFKREAVWEMQGGVKKWVDEMPEEILTSQFPQTPQIYIKDDLVDAFFQQCAVREKEIEMANNMLGMVDDETKPYILNTSFPQTFSECVPYFGKGCQYRNICHGHVENPLTQGFEYRVPHHIPEAEAWANAEQELLSGA